MKFKDYIKIYADHKRPFVKEQTLSAYLMHCKKYLIPYFGEYNIKDINKKEVEKFAFDKLDDGSFKSLKTLQDVLITLKNILRLACEDGYCEYRSISIKFPMKYDKLRSTSNKEIETFNDDEYAKIINYLKSNPTSENIAILITAYTGLRIGEICALTFGDIDLANNVINVQKTLQRSYDENLEKTSIRISTPKTNNGYRKIPLVDDLVIILKRFDGLYPGNWYISTFSEKPCEPRTLREKYKKMLKKIGVRYLKFHGLRHSFATRLIENGVDIKTVSSLMGHSKIEITMDLYVHPSQNQQLNAISNAFNF